MARMLLVALVALALAAPVAAGPPRLQLADSNPLTVRGTGFTPRARVLVRLSGIHVLVRTTPRGRFVAVLRGFDRCSGGRVLAVAAGDVRAVLRLPPLECAPASTP